MKKYKILLYTIFLVIIVFFIFYFYSKTNEEIVLSTLVDAHQCRESLDDVKLTSEMILTSGNEILSDENFKKYYLSMVYNHGTDFGNELEIKSSDCNAEVYSFIKKFVRQSVKYQLPYMFLVKGENNKTQWIKSVRFFPENFIEHSIDIEDINMQQIDKINIMILEHKKPLGLTINIERADIRDGAWKKLYDLNEMLTEFDNGKVQYRVILK